MSTINQWNTNFTYGEYLTSTNMNSSSVGYICPGVYNADIYMRVSNSGSLSLVLKKGTTIVFSHVKDENGNMDFENSYNYCTKCIVTEDTDYVLYNPDTDRNNTSLIDILKSDMFFVYIMKKVVSTNDSSDYIPIIGLLTFEDGKRVEYTVPSIDISTEFDNESTKAYYQLLGVMINTSNNKNIFNGTGALIDSWLQYHIFTTRCLPSYSLRNSLYDHSIHNDIYFLKSGDNDISWNINYKDLYINGNIYNRYTEWEKIYNWDSSSGALSSVSYNNNEKVATPSGVEESDLVNVDFLYAITECEQSGPDDICSIVSDDTALSLNCLSFQIDGTVNLKDNSVRDLVLKRNNVTDEVDGVSYMELYTDNSHSTIERLLDILRGHNVLPKLFNYIRYTRGTSNSDTIIPIAIEFRPVSVGENEKYVNLDKLDPNNTLSFFDLQDGNYNLNYCKNSFQMADILSALDDNPYRV